MKIIIVLTCLFIIYLHLIRPSNKQRDWAPFNKRHYAHRGLHSNKNNTPENTLKAFKDAIKHGFGIEMDIRLTKDNIAVVHHDNDLNRSAGMDMKISDMAYKELKDIKLFGSNETIPSFNKVLSLVGGSVPIIIEIKTDEGDTMKVCEIVSRELDKYNGPYVIESFNPRVVHWCRRNKQEVIRGQLSMNHMKNGSINMAESFVLQFLLLNFVTKPDFVAYDHKYSKNISLRLISHLFKVPIIAYTVKTEEDLKASKAFFDIHIFDSFIPKK